MTQILIVDESEYTDIVSELTLVTGQNYLVQVIGGNAAVMVEEITAPPYDKEGFILKNVFQAGAEPWTVTIPATGSIYVKGYTNTTKIAVGITA